MQHPVLRLTSILILHTLLAGAASAQYVQVSRGRDHSLALRCDGTVELLGYGLVDQPLPPGVTFVEVSSGGAREPSLSAFSLFMARGSDGSVVAWGDNSYGQHNVPVLPAEVSYVEIAAGRLHALARRSDGVVVGWGDNSFGQSSVPGLPPGMQYTQISAGGWDEEFIDYTYIFPTYSANHPSHSAALRSDGAIVTWGSNSHGQRNVPSPPAGLTYVQVSAGSRHMAARLSDGSMVAWGDNTYGQCDVPALPAGVTCTSIDAGGSSTAARLSDGSAISFGTTNFAMPPGDYVAVTSGGTVDESTTTYDLVPGDFYAWAFSKVSALRSDGSIWAWDGSSNQPYVSAGWNTEDLGLGLAGPSGTPTLDVSLDCPGGASQPITMTLMGAQPNSPSILVMGWTYAGLPVLNGTLVPSPDRLIYGQTDGAGGQVTSLDLPPGIPLGQTFFGQVWVLDRFVTGSLSASNGVSITAPL